MLPFPQLAKEADVLCQSDKDQQVQHVYKVCSMLQHVKICRRRVVVGLASHQNEKKKNPRVLRSDISSVSCRFVSLSITVKELKALLPLLNYKAPSSRTLKDKFQVKVVW